MKYTDILQIKEHLKCLDDQININNTYIKKIEKFICDNLPLYSDGGDGSDVKLYKGSIMTKFMRSETHPFCDDDEYDIENMLTIEFNGFLKTHGHDVIMISIPYVDVLKDEINAETICVSIF